MEKGISIIIPNHNSGPFLREAVTSVFQQPFRYPFEVIIVDDGSNDQNTKLILKEVENDFDVKVIRLDRNRGVQHARNTGLKSAIFDYIFTIDSDDQLNTDKNVLKDGTYADRAVDILSSLPDVAFVHGIWLMFGEYEGFTISAYPVTESLILEKHHAQTNIVYRKQDALEAGLYDENIKKWQDWSFAVGILNVRFLSGKKNNIAFLDAPYYLYRIHNQTNRTSVAEISEKEMTRKTILRHPEIFRNHYKDISDEDIAQTVLFKKPNKLKDLLHVASYDINRAINMMTQRGFEIQSTNEPPNIP
jgi:glycosyltransferase involved in cell wall biosynthesis